MTTAAVRPIRIRGICERAGSPEPLGAGWPVLPESWTAVSTTEQVTWYSSMTGEPRVNPCRTYWGSHGCDLQRGHRRGHICDPCEGHPWWLHAIAYWLGRRTGRWGGCVERWPYYGRGTRFYGEDAP